MNRWPARVKRPAPHQCSSLVTVPPDPPHLDALGRHWERPAFHPGQPAVIGHAVIRHDGCGAFLVQLFSPEDGLMVSPSGTRGTGSTKVRAGRR